MVSSVEVSAPDCTAKLPLPSYMMRALSSHCAVDKLQNVAALTMDRQPAAKYVRRRGLFMAVFSLIYQYGGK